MGRPDGSDSFPTAQFSGAAEPCLDEDQPFDVVGEVGEADLRLRPYDPDSSDEERHRPFLVREDMLDPGADLERLALPRRIWGAIGRPLGLRWWTWLLKPCRSMN